MGRPTNTGERNISRKSMLNSLGPPVFSVSLGTKRTPGGHPTSAIERGFSTLEAAIQFRDAVLAGTIPLQKAERGKFRRVWHRPDYNDLGPSAGTSVHRVTERGGEHRRLTKSYKDRGLLKPFDDVKLATVTATDLLGTAARMDMQARQDNRERGRIIVPAPIAQELVDYARNTNGIEVLVIPA